MFELARIATLVVALLLPCSSAFYLPGVAPRNFERGDQIDLKVNKLSSTQTQLPYDYYSLKFCQPADGVKPYSENLGEFLRGDRIENSAYDISMLENKYCKVLCKQSLKAKDSNDFAQAIKRNYHHNWIVDNLPAASILDTDQYVTTQYVGFPVGYVNGLTTFIYNHVNIILEYHDLEDGSSRIVGFYVEPLSIKHKFSGGAKWDGMGIAPSLSTCDTGKRTDYDSVSEHQKVETGDLVFTYSVEFKPSDVRLSLFLSSFLFFVTTGNDMMSI
jgi:transmembrane 9 superfamily protein 2/4